MRIDGNGYKLMEMDEDRSIWMDMDGNLWKFMKIDGIENGNEEKYGNVGTNYSDK